MRYSTDYICTQWCAHPAVSPSFKVPIPQMLCLFSVGELQAAGTQVLGTWLLRWAAPASSLPCAWTNQNLIRNADQQRPSKEKSSLPAKPPQGSKSPSSLLLAYMPQLRPSNRGINWYLEIEIEIETLPDDVVCLSYVPSRTATARPVCPPSLARQYERSTRSRPGITHPIQLQFNHEERNPVCLARHVVPASCPVSLLPPPAIHPPPPSSTSTYEERASAYRWLLAACCRLPLLITNC